jgi:hypothetical protein
MTLVIREEALPLFDREEERPFQFVASLDPLLQEGTAESVASAQISFPFHCILAFKRKSKSTEEKQKAKLANESLHDPN